MNEHTSKELSQRLYDKGYRGEHTHLWADHSEFGEGWILVPCGETDGMPFIPAWTFSEILRELPSHIDKFDLFTRKGDNGLCIVFYAWMGNLNEVLFIESHASPAEAIGLLLEWLIDEGHYKGGE